MHVISQWVVINVAITIPNFIALAIIDMKKLQEE